MDFQINHLPTGDNVADLMTKPSTQVKLNHFHNTMFGEQWNNVLVHSMYESRGSVEWTHPFDVTSV